MSSITLSTIDTAVMAEFAAATPQAQGEAIAAIIRSIDTADKVKATKVARKPAPARKPAKKAATIDTPMAANWNGDMMKSAPGTITKGQIRNLTTIAPEGFDFDITTLSMVEASNEYHAIKVELAA